MTKREYLRSLGFEVGERGRFTDAMKTALKNYDGDFDEPVSKNSRPPVEYKDLTQLMVREARALKGYTKEGYEVGFINCRQCHQHMIFCECAGGILAPKMVVWTDEPDVRLV